MSGCSVGGSTRAVDTVLVALDPMPDVIAEAKETGAQLHRDAPPAVF